VYSTVVAPKWNRKIQCGNACRRINLPLCLVPTPLFLAIPASNNFWTKVSSARNQMLFINQYCAVSNIFFLSYCTVFLKLQYHDKVAFRTKHWMNENLVNDSTANFTFTAVTWKNIIWSFSVPLWCNNLPGHLPGQSTSIFTAFKFFDMFVSTPTPSVFLGEGKVVLVVEIIYLFTFNFFSMVKWLR